jgi:hypothetical protein
VKLRITGRVRYSIDEDLREKIKDRLEYPERGLEWPDGLPPLGEIVEKSNESLVDKRKKLRDIFDDYELAELEAINDQMTWAAYCRLRVSFVIGAFTLLPLAGAFVAFRNLAYVVKVDSTSSCASVFRPSSRRWIGCASHMIYTPNPHTHEPDDTQTLIVTGKVGLKSPFSSLNSLAIDSLL